MLVEEVAVEEVTGLKEEVGGPEVGGARRGGCSRGGHGTEGGGHL